MAKRKNGRTFKKEIVKEEPKVEKKIEKKVVEKVVVNEPKSNWVGTEDLYIVEGNNKIDAAHQFKSQISGIYGVKEYFWKGIIHKGLIKFVRSSGKVVPVPADSNHGYTLVGKAKNMILPENALEVLSESGDQAYVYIQPESFIKYTGDENEHTIYVRIYDNNSGDNNDRWLTLSIE